MADLARERDDLHAAVDRHFEACRTELLAARDDADEDAGAAAALGEIDRQCRLVDQAAGAIQQTLGGDLAAAPRLLQRADDVLSASRRLSERASSAAPTLALRDVGGRQGVGDRLRAYLGTAFGPSARDAPPPPPASATPPGPAPRDDPASVEHLVASLRDEVHAFRDSLTHRDAPASARTATADAPWTPRSPDAARRPPLLTDQSYAPHSQRRSPGDTDDALAVADRALSFNAASAESMPLSPLTDDRYADLLASSLRDVEASAARSSRRRGVFASPGESAAALQALDRRY